MSVFFTIGFRPFFASGILFAALALGLWGFYWFGVNPGFTPFGGMLFWHPHELIMGVALAIIVGFLLTAVRNWTGTETTTPVTLGMLFLSWWVARFTMLVAGTVQPENLPWLIATQISTPLLAAALIARPILRARMWRNLFAPIVLVLFASLDSWILLVMHSGQAFPSTLFHAAILLVVLMMTIIGGRVIPLFTANRLSIAKVTEKHGALLFATLPLLILLALTLGHALLPGLYKVLSPVLALMLCITHGYRLSRWHDTGIWQHPMLWSLFVFYACIPIGFGLMALNPYLQWGSVPWHMLTAGAMSGLIVSMVARVSLGHTGRMIVHDRIILSAFFCVIVSALFRTLGVAIFGLHPHLILASALTAALGMALIFGRFSLVWLTPRADA